jgi:hypothetical protein
MNNLEFKDVNYNPNTICWGVGNRVVGPNLLASFRLKEMSKEEEDLLKLDYEKAKQIYEKHIIKGAKFIPCGKKANTSIEAKITSVNIEKQYVTWKQYNLTDEQISNGYIPAAGKFSINTLISLVKTNEIKFL